MSSWHSYPKIYALGHAALNELFFDDVVVEEKIDGSQFSFGIFDGDLKVRSKGVQMVVDAPEKMFQEAVDYVKSIQEKLVNNYTYRAEYLKKPKHNSLAYDRIPQNHLIVFDINRGEEDYLSYEDKKREANLIGLETVPLLFQGKIHCPEVVQSFLERTSVLGGQKIEGVVVKNYAKFGADKKALMGKYVSEAFKEVHAKEWKVGNPKGGDVIQDLVMKYRTPARWSKAVQHLRDKGQLEGSPKDIGNLIKEMQADLLAECTEEIKQYLFNWASAKILRGCTGGLPQWYKEELLKGQFNAP